MESMDIQVPSKPTDVLKEASRKINVAYIVMPMVVSLGALLIALVGFTFIFSKWLQLPTSPTLTFVASVAMAFLALFLYNRSHENYSSVMKRLRKLSEKREKLWARNVAREHYEWLTSHGVYSVYDDRDLWRSLSDERWERDRLDFFGDMFIRAYEYSQNQYSSSYVQSVRMHKLEDGKIEDTNIMVPHSYTFVNASLLRVSFSIENGVLDVIEGWND